MFDVVWFFPLSFSSVVHHNAVCRFFLILIYVLSFNVKKQAEKYFGT